MAKQTKQNILKVGRRKEAIARAFFTKGKGKITINGIDYKKYFPLVYLQNKVASPLKLVEGMEEYDISVNAKGGGKKGQAEATKLAIAKLLCEINIEFRPVLKKAGMLTRDSRAVERKKYGLRKARKSTQYSKR